MLIRKTIKLKKRVNTYYSGNSRTITILVTTWWLLSLIPIFSTEDFVS